VAIKYSIEFTTFVHIVSLVLKRSLIKALFINLHNLEGFLRSCYGFRYRFNLDWKVWIHMNLYKLGKNKNPLLVLNILLVVFRCIANWLKDSLGLNFYFLSIMLVRLLLMLKWLKSRSSTWICMLKEERDVLATRTFPTKLYVPFYLHLWIKFN
jgi:hypothetical protein